MYRPESDLRFRVIEPLGRGGTAEVVRVFYHRLKREAALKFELEHPPDNVSFSSLAQREYFLIGDLRYPGLVRLLEEPQDGTSLVLELCPGPTLDAVLPIRDIRTALNVLCSIAINLEFIRAAGLIHGDLKPHNIFLPTNWATTRLGRGYTKLSDFSLGRKLSEPDRSRLGLGTVGYMAPETITEKITSHQSDLFALGVIAYQVLTGKHPFMQNETEPVKINARIQEDEPTSVSNLRADAPEAVARLVTQLLAKKPEDRPDCAYTVCEHLQQAGADFPFQKAIRPSLLFRKDDSYTDNVRNLLSAGEKTREELERMTGRSKLDLRLILSYSFLRGQLRYGRNGFRVVSHFHWPSCLRNRYLTGFGRQNISEQKRLLKQAVVQKADYSSQPSDDSLVQYPPVVMDMLLRFMRPATVRHVANDLAVKAEKENHFEAATRFSVMAGDLETAVLCSHPASRELQEQDNRPEALNLLTQVTELAELQDQQFETREVLMQRADLMKELGDVDRALEEYNQLVALYEGKPEDNVLAETFKDIGAVHRQKQDSQAALAALKKALSVYEQLGDELEISHVNTNIGNVYWVESNLKKALHYYRAALKIQKRVADKADIASTLHNIATIYCLDGRVKRGIFLLNKALELKREVGHSGEIARTLNNLGYAYNLSGETENAASCLKESLTINRRIGSRKEVLYNLENLVSLLITSGELTEAAGQIAEGIELSRTGNYPYHEGALKVRNAIVHKRTGRFGQASELLDEATALADGVDDPALKAEIEIQRASLRYYIGDKSGALEIIAKVLEKVQADKNQPAELDCHLLLARLHDDQAQLDQALEVIDELHLSRERVLLEASVLERCLEPDSCENEINTHDSLAEFTSHHQKDIETPWILNLAAEQSLRMGKLDAASDYANRSLELANARDQLPEQGVALILSGRIANENKDYEVGYAAYRKALGIFKQMLATITDSHDRQVFQSGRSVQFLAREIVELSKKLGKK